MPIDPRHQPLTAEAKEADRLAAIERRLARIEAGSLNLVTRRRVRAEESSDVATTVATPVDLGGPSVTIEVPADSFVAVFAEAHFKTSVGLSSARVWLYEPTDFPSGTQILANALTSYTTIRTAPANAGGVAVGQTAGEIIYPLPTVGARTYSLRYSCDGGAQGNFQNRRLWIEVR